MPRCTPSRSTPGIDRSRLRCAPTAISTASKPLPPQLADGEVASGGRIQAQGDVASFEDLAHLRLDNTSRQTILGDSEVQHSSGDGGSLEDCDRVTHQREIMCSRETDRPSADDGDLVGKFLARPCIGRNRTTRLGPVPLGQEALESANGDRPIDLTSSARGFARMCANASANARHGIGIARKAIRVFELTFRNQRDVAAGIGVCGARHHAGEVGIQPLPIDLLVSETT